MILGIGVSFLLFILAFWKDFPQLFLMGGVLLLLMSTNLAVFGWGIYEPVYTKAISCPQNCSYQVVTQSVEVTSVLSYNVLYEKNTWTSSIAIFLILISLLAILESIISMQNKYTN